jgi:hypothetical protein
MTPDDRYTLSNSQDVAALFRQVMDRAAAEGRLPIALRASRWAMEELERTPLEFGEAREYLPGAELQLRIAFVRPVYVAFGVRERTRTVFIRRFGWSG